MTQQRYRDDSRRSRDDSRRYRDDSRRYRDDSRRYRDDSRRSRDPRRSYSSSLSISKHSRRWGWGYYFLVLILVAIIAVFVYFIFIELPKKDINPYVDPRDFGILLENATNAYLEAIRQGLKYEVFKRDGQLPSSLQMQLITYKTVYNEALQRKGIIKINENTTPGLEVVTIFPNEDEVISDNAVAAGTYVELSESVNTDNSKEKYKLILSPTERFVEYDVNRTLYLTEVPLDYKVTTSEGKKYTQGSQYSKYQISGKIRIERHVVSITSIPQKKIYIFPYIASTGKYDLSRFNDITGGTIEIPEKEFTVDFFKNGTTEKVTDLHNATKININRHGIIVKFSNNKRLVYTYSKIMNMINANKTEQDKLESIHFFPPNTNSEFKVIVSKDNSNNTREITRDTSSLKGEFDIMSFKKSVQ